MRIKYFKARTIFFSGTFKVTLSIVGFVWLLQCDRSRSWLESAWTNNNNSINIAASNERGQSTGIQFPVIHILDWKVLISQIFQCNLSSVNQFPGSSVFSCKCVNSKARLHYFDRQTCGISVLVSNWNRFTESFYAFKWDLLKKIIVFH